MQFYLVYIREAHPTDGWQVNANEREKVLFAQPKDWESRTEVAHQMCTKLEVKLPTLIDNLDDKVGKDYSAWPDRLYLVGVDGKIAYKSEPGPRGFKPEGLQAAIKTVLAPPEKKTSKK